MSASTAPTWSAWACSRSSSSATPPAFDGSETFTITGVANLQPRQEIDVQVEADGVSSTFRARVRIDTANELEYFRHGGILHFVLRQLGGAERATSVGGDCAGLR